jgi:EAL domain-containing protein (putative c-di-GMP-specific phosphodiesterase class I)/GGDEF domain-containing protein
MTSSTRPVDALTGLLDRAAFLEHLETAPPCAVFVLDIRGFRHIDSLLGGEGDAVLCRVGERIGGGIRRGGAAARLYGDVFAWTGPAAAPVEIARLARRMADRVGAPVAVGAHVVHPEPRVGVALPSATDRRDGLRFAETALRRCPSDTQVAVYDAETDADAPIAARLAAELEGALARHELGLVLQPIHDLRSMEIAGYEALIRWFHPELGVVGPDRFVPAAERSRAILSLGSTVLDLACRELAERRRRGLRAVPIGINVSPRQLERRRLVHDVAEALATHGVPPELLRVELTEHALVGPGAAPTVTLHELRALGVGLSLDDFGSGFSSLRYLADLPFDTIKLDREFLKIEAPYARRAHVARATVVLAHDLDMKVVAEGISDDLRLNVAHDLGCDEGQGWHLGLPERALVSAEQRAG